MICDFTKKLADGVSANEKVLDRLIKRFIQRCSCINCFLECVDFVCSNN